MIEQNERDIVRQRELDKMIQRLSRVLQKDGEMRRRLDETTGSPTPENVEQLWRLMEGMRSNIAEVLPSVQMFEDEVVFMEQPDFPLPENIRSAKVGLIEHAVIQQMQRIDTAQHQPTRYETFNRLLSRKIQAINNSVDVCLRNLSQKL